MRQYRGRYFIRQRVWRCGDYIDVEAYPVFQQPGKRRAKCNPTREAQKRLNQRAAEKQVTRLLHLNFGLEDYELDLTFAEIVSEEECKRRLDAFIRKLRRLYQKAGKELRYLYTVETGKKSGRTHIHMPISGGIGRDALEEAWGQGYANSRRLQFTEKGITGLAKYICKEGRPEAGTEKRSYRRWSCSKNLIRPVPETKDGEITVKEMQEAMDAIERRNMADSIRESFPGYELVEANALKNNWNAGIYLEISICRKERWRGIPHAEYSVVETGDA